jgi:hypothetical protein
MMCGVAAIAGCSGDSRAVVYRAGYADGAHRQASIVFIGEDGQRRSVEVATPWASSRLHFADGVAPGLRVHLPASPTSNVQCEYDVGGSVTFASEPYGDCAVGRL